MVSLKSWYNYIISNYVSKIIWLISEQEVFKQRHICKICIDEVNSLAIEFNKCFGELTAGICFKIQSTFFVFCVKDLYNNKLWATTRNIFVTAYLCVFYSDKNITTTLFIEDLLV